MGNGHVKGSMQWQLPRGGSASILPHNLRVYKNDGAEGLRKATEFAILNANYIASPLTPTMGCSIQAKTDVWPTN